jgi:hypothetical protein
LAFNGITAVFSGGGQRPDDPFVGFESFVGDQRIGLHVWQEFVRAHEIVGLATGQVKTNRVAERINQRVNFGAQSAA